MKFFPDTSVKCLLALWFATMPAVARPWTFVGIPEPHEADFVGMENGAVVLRGPNGKSDLCAHLDR